MSGLRNWFSRLFGSGRAPSGPLPSFRPLLEHLEARQLLSAYFMGNVPSSFDSVSSVRTTSGAVATFAVVNSDHDALWEYNPLYNPGGTDDQHWYRITPARVTQISATTNAMGDPVVLAVVGSDNNSLWEYDPQFGPTNALDYHWTELTTASVGQISATRNSDGNMVVFATIASAGNSLWVSNPQINPGAPLNAHWAQITPANVAQISATQYNGQDPVVFATIASAGNSLWEYNPHDIPSSMIDMHWAQITPAAVGQISAVGHLSGDPVVFATIASAGNSLWEYEPLLNPGGSVDMHWQRLTSASVSQISAAQDGPMLDPVVFATIASAGDALWEYNPHLNPGGSVDMHWQQLTPTNVVQIGAAVEYNPANSDPYYPVVFATIASARNALWKYDPYDSPQWSQVSPSAGG
jgi:hypothetical protein